MKRSQGYTLVELLIVISVLGILGAIAMGMITGGSIIPSKQSCLAAGGKWSEGLQFGRVTQLCTYN